MYEQIKAWLKLKNWPSSLEQFKNKSVFELEVPLQNGTYRTMLYAKKNQHFFGVYVFAPFKIAPKHHADLLEIIAGANWGYEHARFELNPETGEFRCCSTAYLPNNQLSMEMVEGMVTFVLGWLEGFMPALKGMAVVI